MIPLLIIGGAVAYFFLKNKNGDDYNSETADEVKQSRIAALSSPIMATTRTQVANPQTTSPTYTTPKVIRSPQTQIRPMNQRRVK